MTATHRSPCAPPAGGAIEDAQQRLTRLLIAEDRDLPAIIEAADMVRRAERQTRESNS